jgi:hypothetical protein
VARDEVAAAVVARRLEADKRETRVAISSADFFHPSQLPRETAGAIGQADLVVIDVGAFFVASSARSIDVSRLPRWAAGINERVRHLREVREGVLRAYPRGERWVEAVETGARSLAVAALRPLIRHYPRPTLEEYESLLTEAVSRIQGAGLRLVLQGPAGFNLDEMGPAYSPDTPRIYDAINAMARRVAEAAHVPMVDRMAIGRDHPSLFLPATSRHSPVGHRVMGEALAARLLGDGLV